MAELTLKQRRFCQEYVVDLNAAAAARRAGYSKATARQIAASNLSKVDIQEEVARLNGELSRTTHITAERVLRELALIGFANMADMLRTQEDGSAYVDFSMLTRDQAAAIGEVTIEEYKDGKGEDARDIKKTKFKLLDKKGALVDLGRHLKLFTDKHEHGGTVDGQPFVIKIVKHGDEPAPA